VEGGRKYLYRFADRMLAIPASTGGAIALVELTVTGELQLGER